jgi:hypothetical protein
VSQHAAPPVAQLMIYGRATTDHGAVQAHITRLEAAEQNRQETERDEFVSALARDNKILATQIDAVTAFVKGLDTAQFESYKGQWALAGPVPLTQPQATNQPTDTNAPQATEADKAKQYRKDLEEQVDRLRRSGMQQHQLERTRPYQELASLSKTTA